MAQGEFTKEEAENTRVTVEEIWRALPKKKQFEFVGHLNDIFLFLEAAKIHAPTEAEQ